MQPASVASGPRRGAPVLGGFAQSSIGAKWVMAITGILFLGWLAAHLLGNLQVFAGAETYNHYAAILQNNPLLLWGQRAFVFVVLVLHVTSAVRISSLNRAARGGQRYAVFKPRVTTLGARTMAYTGFVILGFVVFHLLHFTGGVVFPAEFHVVDALGNHDVSRMVIASFQRPGVVAIYVFAMALVGLHLSHGIWSAIQTLGLNGKRWTPFAVAAGRVISALLAVGFLSIPLAILLGLAK